MTPFNCQLTDRQSSSSYPLMPFNFQKNGSIELSSCRFAVGDREGKESPELAVFFYPFKIIV
jgi:hypothetical protein